MFRYPPPRFLLLRKFSFEGVVDLGFNLGIVKNAFLNRKSFNLFLQSLKSEEKQ